MDKARLKRLEASAAKFAEVALKTKKSARKALAQEGVVVSKKKVLVRKRDESSCVAPGADKPTRRDLQE